MRWGVAVSLVAGQFLFDSEGRRMRFEADGRGMVHDASEDPCCGFTPGIPCSYCTGPTPAQLSVVFTGLSYSFACFGCPSGWHKVISIDDVNNVPLTLTQVSGNPCRWHAQWGSIHWHYLYQLPNCQGTFTDITWPCHIYVDYVVDRYQVMFLGCQLGSAGPAYFLASSAPGGCGDGFGPLANSYVTAGCGGGTHNAGFGGFVTVNPV